MSEEPIEWVNELGARRWQPRLNDDRRAWDDDLQGVYIWGRSSYRHPALFRSKRRAARIARRQERDDAGRAWERANPVTEETTVSLTDDPNDTRLTHGADDEPTEMAEVYLVLSDEEREAGFVRPLRHSYTHETCDTATTMGPAIAETYARDPKFYSATFCVYCQMHRPVSEFIWDDGQVVGS